MKVLVRAALPSDSLGVSRLQYQDYAFALKVFLDRVILLDTQELRDSLKELSLRDQNRLSCFIDLWQRHPRVNFPSGRFDFTLKVPKDIITCFDDPSFLAASELRKPQGKKGEKRQVFYSRIFEPFVEASTRIEIFDPWILTNLVKSRSGLKWILENKISKTPSQLVLVTVMPRRERHENDEVYKGRVSGILSQANSYLSDLVAGQDFGIRLYLLPESSNTAYAREDLADQESDKHDRFFRFTFKGGSMGVGLTKGTEYFASDSLSHAWRVEMFDHAAFSDSISSWSLHKENQARVFSFGSEFEHDLDCYRK